MRNFHDDRPKKPLKASHIYRDLRDLIWPRRKLFAVGLVLVFINRVAGLVLPGSTRYLIDDVVQKRQVDLLYPLAAAVGGAILVQAATSFALTHRSLHREQCGPDAQSRALRADSSISSPRVTRL